MAEKLMDKKQEIDDVALKCHIMFNGYQNKHEQMTKQEGFDSEMLFIKCIANRRNINGWKARKIQISVIEHLM